MSNRMAFPCVQRSRHYTPHGMKSTPVEPRRISARSLAGPVLALMVLAFALLAVFSSIGASPASPILTLLVVIDRIVGSGWPVAIYLASALGVGVLLRPFFNRDGAWCVTLALGLAIQLSISHAIGVLGLLSASGGTGAWIALAPGIAGLLLFARRLVRTKEVNRDSAISPTPRCSWREAGALALASIPTSLLVVAACNPPGWLWASEARGYDALSYHLALPQEWIATGKIWPSAHNVYSYLPSYIESAFVHLGVLEGAAKVGADPSIPWGLLANEGAGAYTAQFLHVAFAMLAAWGVASMIRQASPDRAIVASLLAAAFLAIPWIVVTGSLAYNDVAVLFFFAAGVVAAIDASLPPLRRGVLVGVVAGAACGCKPTALLFVGLPLGVHLLFSLQPRQWLRAIAAASIAGLLMLSPWLVRNAIASGNPVFPFAASIFGRGAWSSEQIDRYNHAHHAAISLIERLRLLILPDLHDPAGPRHRGLFHPQWSFFFPLVFIAAIASILPRSKLEDEAHTEANRHPALAWIVILIIQIALWLATTHLQSRFLLPLAIPGVVLIALALRRVPSGIASALACIIALAFSIHSIVIFAAEPIQPPSHPNALLIPGTALRTGEFDRDALAQASGQDRQRLLEALGPEAYINLVLPSSARVLLVGGATPFYISRPVVYCTTWDESVLVRSLREHRSAVDANAGTQGFDAVAADLRRLGITHLLVDFAELDRLGRSGFRDPELDPTRIHSFLVSKTKGTHSWGDTGLVLVELSSP